MSEVRCQRSESAIRIPQSEIQKSCPICSETKSVSEFGVARSRTDGRNLYCKSCIRKKVADSRRALKEYRARRKQVLRQSVLFTEESIPPLTFSQLSPVERVKKALARGARTQTEISKEAGTGADETGDAIAMLLLWTREITTRMVGETRHYFMRDTTPPVTVPRKADVIAPHYEARSPEARWRVA